MISIHGGGGDVAALRGVAERALVAISRSASELSVVLCDDAFIQPLNKEWRDQDLPTDVLSFPQGPGPGADLLGDIVISSETAARQAVDHGHSLQAELEVLLIHGLCHLIGLDHRDDAETQSMRAEEERILRVVGLEARSGLVTRAKSE